MVSGFESEEEDAKRNARSPKRKTRGVTASRIDRLIGYSFPEDFKDVNVRQCKYIWRSYLNA